MPKVTLLLIASWKCFSDNQFDKTGWKRGEGVLPQKIAKVLVVPFKTSFPGSPS